MCSVWDFLNSIPAFTKLFEPSCHCSIQQLRITIYFMGSSNSFLAITLCNFNFDPLTFFQFGKHCVYLKALPLLDWCIGRRHQHPQYPLSLYPGTFPESKPFPHLTIHSISYPTHTLSLLKTTSPSTPDIPSGPRDGHGQLYGTPMLTCSWAFLNRISLAPSLINPAYG